MKKNKIVYVPMGADVIHSGHLNIINKAKKYGDIFHGVFFLEEVFRGNENPCFFPGNK